MLTALCREYLSFHLLAALNVAFITDKVSNSSLTFSIELKDVGYIMYVQCVRMWYLNQTCNQCTVFGALRSEWMDFECTRTDSGGVECAVEFRECKLLFLHPCVWLSVCVYLLPCHSIATKLKVMSERDIVGYWLGWECMGMGVTSNWIIHRCILY